MWKQILKSWAAKSDRTIDEVYRLNAHLNPNEWEHYFTEEALLVEDLLASGDIAFINQSKIRIALDNNILSWDKYKHWVLSKNNFPILKSDLSTNQIQELKTKFNENKKTFLHYGIWSDDLIALELWDQQLIILGLMPHEKIFSMPEAIFVLCTPKIMNQILDLKIEHKDEASIDKNDPESALDNGEQQLLEIDQNITKPIGLNFSSILNDTTLDPKKDDANTKTSTTASIWTTIDNNHQSHCELIRKQFDAYIVLKISNNKTQIYKMDDDLHKENLNESLFKYDLNQENPFSKVIKNRTSDSFNLDQLGLVILDFKYVCISPLKLGTQILGFLVGLKVNELTEKDEDLLEHISDENAA